MGEIYDMSDIKVVVFDLDDTLYSELDYVKSGLEFVANNVSLRLGLESSEFLNLFLKSLSIGRSNVFDRALDELSLKNSRNIKQCVALYRGHIPKINLYPNALNIITKMANQYSVYIVTDGNKLVQKIKLKALGLYDSPIVKKAFITYRYGVKNAKPSPYCFNKIAQFESVEPKDIVYIADNAKKDFVGIKPLGYKTIRVLSGQHKDCCYGDEYEAEYIIDKLSNILSLFQ